MKRGAAVTRSRDGSLAVGFVGVALTLVGCAADKKKDERPATSLVYSPASQLPAESDASRRPPVVGLQTGRRCRVHFRRDAVGLAGQAPLSILGLSAMSERAQLVGTIERVDPDGITLRADTSTYWVPREAILAVEFPDQP